MTQNQSPLGDQHPEMRVSGSFWARHYSCTTRMGRASDSVCDPRGRVYGAPAVEKTGRSWLGWVGAVFHGKGGRVQKTAFVCLGEGCLNSDKPTSWCECSRFDSLLALWSCSGYKADPSGGPSCVHNAPPQACSFGLKPAFPKATLGVFGQRRSASCEWPTQAGARASQSWARRRHREQSKRTTCKAPSAWRFASALHHVPFGLQRVQPKVA